MALNPEVIVLDEPFAGLDRKTQSFLQDFLAQMKQSGKTLIIATHDDGLTNSLADQQLNLTEE
jgi:cobalt/nickel transport system ATP-binding protein